jgi:penicillin-insensitive murein endopeptidase
MLTGGFYAADMDGNGQFAGGRIDFEAMASHLAALHLVGQARGVPIRRVIFDPALQPMLFATQKGRILMSRIRFSENRSWFRHDAHYHVDFDVPCRPFDR